MKLGATPGEIVRFGIFEVDFETGELRRNGLKLKLQDQPFAILRALLERPGEIVTREELRQRLWPSDTFVDFDHSLNTAVNKLRSALGDSAQNPRFIVTVPRHGLRFVSPIDVIEKPHRKRSKVRRLPWLAAAVLIPIALLGAFWLWSAGPPSTLIPVPLSTLPGSELSPSFSPSGSELAFMWPGPNADNWDIYVKQFGEETPVRLTDDPATDFSPEWSPDGQSIAFTRLLPSGKLKYLVKSHRGGSERVLAEASPCEPSVIHFSRLISWHPDGAHVVFVDRPAVDEPCGLFLMALKGGTKTRLTGTVSGGEDGDPAFSPDGRVLAFVRGEAWPLRSVHLLTVSDKLTPVGEPKRLTVGSERENHPRWLNSREVVYTCGTSWSDNTLCRIGTDGTGRSRMAGVGYTVQSSTVSPSGLLVYALIPPLTVGLGRIELDENGRAVGDIREVRFSSRPERLPDFSPDGKRITLQSERSGYREIWVSDSDGSNPVQLTTFGGPDAGAPHWSPDGKRITFSCAEEHQRAIYVIEVANGEIRRLATGTHPRWSRDGRRIYFSSTVAGRREIWRLPAGGGEAVQLTRHGGWVPQESWDSKYFYFRKAGGTTESLWRMPVEGGVEEHILDSLTEPGGYFASKAGIYFLHSDDPIDRPRRRCTLRFHDIGTRQTREVANIQGDLDHGLAVSPDGRYVLFTRVTRKDSDLMLVKGFR